MSTLVLSAIVAEPRHGPKEVQRILAEVHGVSERQRRWPGLADLGRKVDLVERSIRRGAGGDPELAGQMQHQDRGEFDE